MTFSQKSKRQSNAVSLVALQYSAPINDFWSRTERSIGFLTTPGDVKAMALAELEPGRA